MSRTTVAEVDVIFELEAETPLHVGGAGDESMTDLLVAVNGKGEAIVPGTSIAGAVRDWSRALLGDDSDEFFDLLWGWVPAERQQQRPDGRNEDDKAATGMASRVLIDDAVLALDGEPITAAGLPVRHGIGIHRRWGTVADKLLFTRQVVPAGAVLSVRMTIECDNDAHRTAAKRFIVALHAALQNQGISLGAASARGLGRLRLHQPIDGDVHPAGPVRWRERLFTSRAALVASLRARRADEWKSVQDLGDDGFVDTRRRLRLEIDWEPDGPMMVRSAADGLAVDTLPEITVKHMNAHLLLSGSSIRGPLRQEAEAIVRTITQPPNQAVPDRLDQAVVVELVDGLFGAAALKGSDRAAGAARIGDCISRSRVPVEAWREFELTASDDDSSASVAVAVEQLREAGFDLDVAFHVALSRFTGGASDALLFTAVEPGGIEWEPIVIDIDLDFVDADGKATRRVQPESLMLLLIVLSRLNHRAVQLGYGANRGYGNAIVKGVRVTATNVDEDDAALHDLITGSSVPIDELDVSGLRQAWDEWRAVAAYSEGAA